MQEWAIWVAGAAVTLIGALAALLLKAYSKRIDDSERARKEERIENDKKIADLTKKLDEELRARDSRRDSIVKEIFEKIHENEKAIIEADKTLTGRIHDMELTATDFGRIYVSKTEYDADHKRKEKPT